MARSSENVALQARSSRAVERRNRDGEVLDAAIRIMAAKGYSAMSVQEVADAVGVLKGSLYHYFASKEDLLFRVIEDSYSRASATAEEVASLGLEPLEELCEYLHRQAIWYFTQQDRAKIYFTEARHLKGERLEKMKDQAREYQTRLLNLIIAAKEAGSIKSRTDPRILCRYIEGSLENLRNWSGSAFRNRSNEELAEEFVSLTRHAIEAQS